MAGVITSEIDITKCPTISSLWKYAGLDVVMHDVSTKSKNPDKIDEIISSGQPYVLGESEDGKREISYGDGIKTYTNGDHYIEPVYEGRSRKENHLVPKEYVNRKGEITKTKGITFNPFLKTKIIGVLGTSFLRSGGHDKVTYDEYKHRLKSSFEHKDKTDGHQHNMAIRFMIKMFLLDMWRVWRELEGLPVPETYQEAILHHKHNDHRPRVLPTAEVVKLKPKKSQKAQLESGGLNDQELTSHSIDILPHLKERGFLVS
jgi:hypothetical protein